MDVGLARSAKTRHKKRLEMQEMGKWTRTQRKIGWYSEFVDVNNRGKLPAARHV